MSRVAACIWQRAHVLNIWNRDLKRDLKIDPPRSVVCGAIKGRVVACMTKRTCSVCMTKRPEKRPTQICGVCHHVTHDCNHDSCCGMHDKENMFCTRGKETLKEPHWDLLCMVTILCSCCGVHDQENMFCCATFDHAAPRLMSAILWCMVMSRVAPFDVYGHEWCCAIRRAQRVVLRRSLWSWVMLRHSWCMVVILVAPWLHSTNLSGSFVKSRRRSFVKSRWRSLSHACRTGFLCHIHSDSVLCIHNQQRVVLLNDCTPDLRRFFFNIRVYRIFLFACM